MGCYAAHAYFVAISFLFGAFAYDEGQDITLCWITNVSKPDERPRREDCQGARVEFTRFPEEMRSDKTYTISFLMAVPLDLRPQDAFPHFNVHSCPRAIGFCTPFVADRPELATHSPELTASAQGGVATFDNEVRLPAGQYTIIGHGRWVDAEGNTHDMARARINDVSEPPKGTPVSFYWALTLGMFVGLLFVVGLIILVWYLVKLYQEHRAAKVKLDQENRMRICEAIVGVQKFRYPFCITKFSVFKSFGQLWSHEQCRDAGHLIYLDTWDRACEFAVEHRVLFVSHQWLAFDQPDPNNVHYPVILQAVQEILQESGVPEDDLYVWVDYQSMPQQCHASLSNAIASLSAYVPVCKWFLICAPSAMHLDRQVPVDGETYKRRGWCRFEQWARLTSGGLCDMYVFRGEKLERLCDPIFEPWVRESINVFQGEYSNPGDMKELVNLTLGLWGYTLLGLADMETDRLKQQVLDDKRRVFPTEHFGELVEALESEISSPENFQQFRDGVTTIMRAHSPPPVLRVGSNDSMGSAMVRAIRSMPMLLAGPGEKKLAASATVFF